MERCPVQLFNGLGMILKAPSLPAYSQYMTVANQGFEGVLLGYPEGLEMFGPTVSLKVCHVDGFMSGDRFILYNQDNDGSSKLITVDSNDKFYLKANRDLNEYNLETDLFELWRDGDNFYLKNCKYGWVSYGIEGDPGDYIYQLKASGAKLPFRIYGAFDRVGRFYQF